MLLRIGKGKYRDETLLFHEIIDDTFNQKVLLVTDSHIFIRVGKDLMKQWKENLYSMFHYEISMKFLIKMNRHKSTIGICERGNCVTVKEWVTQIYH